jgi:hypothetical protein
MASPQQEQLRFLPIAGHTVRGDFDGGALSSDFGPLLMRGIDRQIGLIERMAAAIHDRRHPSYVEHELRDLLGQRIFQTTSGYEDQNDATPVKGRPKWQQTN